MKLKNMLYYLAIIILVTTQVFATNTNPVVTNVAFSISGTTVTVTYDVADAEQSTLTISMEVSSDNGLSWDFNYGTATGDIGNNISKGNNKTITWTYSGGYNDQFIIRIIANDLVIDGGPCATPTVTYAGKTYNTVQIGTQCWLKENLDIGTRINGSVYQTNNSTIEKYCYNDDPANCTIYGGLYQWNEAMQYVTTPGTKGICPTGWHIPTYSEFQTLATTVSNDGNALKAIGQGGTSTNTSGFSALLAGYRVDGGGFGDLGNSTFFCVSTETAESYFYGVYLDANDSYVGFTYGYKGNGNSVRCLKN